jgi:tetratricopeptide (TPR) repeat protein
MNRVAVALLIWLCGLASPATASAKWTRLSSRHFVFVGDASERDIRNIARRLEQFREVVGRVLSDEATRSPVPTIVVVFENDRSFTPFKPMFQGKPADVAGYFAGTEDVNYIAVNAEQDGQAFGLIFHEFAHVLIGNAVALPPAWINEGLAEFYETFESSNGGKTAMLGMPSARNLQLLKAHTTLLPIAQLIDVDHASPMYNERDRRGLFYAQSWALVHYLTFGSPERVGQLKHYLALVGQGLTGTAAFQQAFGSDTAALERDLQRYVRGLTHNALRLDFDETLESGVATRGEVIPAHEAAGYLGDLLARINRPNDARAYLRKTIDANGEAALALAALGLLELRASHDDVAFPLIERAASLAPDLATVQRAWGRALTRRADRGASDEGALYARARTVLTGALQLEPDNMSAAVTLAQVEMASGTDPATAVALMRRAVTAAPGREEYRLMLAQALAMNGDYQGASDLLGPLVARGSRPEIQDAARKTLGRMAAVVNAVREAAASSSTDQPTESPR